ncbi:MAG: TonB-dependent receptor plug domain-containing protein, partial [Xanthomonadales bacterium]|nr:TonB-dependent receptor plug domain-containing protein [Xanthomonadales bacterium]
MDAILALILLTTPGATVSNDAETVLEEVIVTATKRETALSDTAMSVAVLDQSQLIAADLLSIEDYWRQIPSLAYSDQGFAGDGVAIRGLGNDVNSNVESLTSFYLGDVPLTPPDGLFTASPDLALVDIQRLEVLRGPQGTLFGASAMGGAIRAVTNQPDPSGASHWLDVRYADIAHGGESI